MPKMDGLEVCRRIRKLGNTPVMMLTAKGETFDKVLGLELGADDYMVKPFDTKEVVARIKAVLRRCTTTTAQTESTEGVIEFDNLRLDKMCIRDRRWASCPSSPRIWVSSSPVCGSCWQTAPSRA